MTDIVAHVLLANTKIYDKDDSYDNSSSTFISMWTNMSTTINSCFETTRMTKINPIHVEIDTVDIDITPGKDEIVLVDTFETNDKDKNDKDKLIPVHIHTKNYNNNNKTKSGSFFTRIWSNFMISIIGKDDNKMKKMTKNDSESKTRSDEDETTFNEDKLKMKTITPINKKNKS